MFKWEGVLAIGGLLGGLVVFIKNVLTIRKLGVENQIIKRKLDEPPEPSQLIVEPTPQQIAEYGKGLRNLKSQNVLGMLLVVAGACSGGYLVSSYSSDVAMLRAENNELARAQDAFASSLHASEVAGALNNLGTVLRDAGRLQEAQSAYLRALDLGRSNPHQVALAHNNLGLLLSQRGDYEKAQDSFERALALFRQLGSRGEESSVLSNLGSVYLSQSDAAVAEEYYRHALEIAVEILGMEHPKVVSILEGLGDAQAQNKNYVEAELSYKRAIDVMEVALGAESSRLLSILEKLASALKSQGRDGEAATYRQKAAALRRSESG